MTAPVELEWDDERGLLHVWLARPKANLIDGEMISAMSEVLRPRRGMRALLIDHRGPHFSFGASVEEHLPDQCAKMLGNLHHLIRQLVDFPLPTLVATRGQCLGGGLEVAAAGHLIFAATDSKFGQPEIRLGVFAPAASVLLPERLGQAAADDLLWSGRTILAPEALSLGLVTSVAADPTVAALAYFDDHLAAHSPSSLRFAVQASRAAWRERVQVNLQNVERLYLEGLMATADAKEGLLAFLEKRPPRWETIR